MKPISSHILFIAFLLLSSTAFAAGVGDTLGKGANITDNQTLVSPGGTFTLGFFTTGVSTKRYLGIWFSVSREAICWVANRDRALNDNAGVLVISDTGNLLLLDGARQISWSSNSSSTSPVEAQLLDNGNLVVRNRGSTNLLWQSFDHPSNTLLSGMKLGKNLWTDAEWYLTSWRAADDPSPGAYRRVLETSGLPELIVWQGSVKTYRTGPWNGRWFSGVPEVSSYEDLVKFRVTTTSPGEISYGYVAKAGAPLTRVVLTEAGMARRLVWDASRQTWQTLFQGPRDVCDAYGRCGAFGLCDASAAATLFCGCLRGFSPASPSAWNRRDFSGGCRRDVALDCAMGQTTDGFQLVRGVKLPDTHTASVDMSMTPEECKARCLANCSCLAYAAADIRGGDVRSGCVMWTDIMDLRYVDPGQDLYLRLAKSELPPPRQFPTALVIGISVGATMVVVILVVLLVLFVIRHRRRPPTSAAPSIQPSPASTVPYVELSKLIEATENFSQSKLIGEGGFSDVYEGVLPDGSKVAVKRLRRQSSPANEGAEVFMREVEVMSNLRHGNLVQLLSYCNDENERILVYEYMENKSLNRYIFARDPNTRASLNWRRRVEIVVGVAKGVAYLHASKKVIHRDLKPSNILLDDNWRAKIADFGTAKQFIDGQTNPTLVQTAGYTAPEYAAEGHLTLKCDVYSFGVLVIEIISGKRNNAMPTLLSDAWQYWNGHSINGLLDSAVAPPESELLSALERCVQIGLLCVQQLPDDRPMMSEVVTMLTDNSSRISRPQRPKPGGRAGSPPREMNILTQGVSGHSGAHNDSIYFT